MTDRLLRQRGDEAAVPLSRHAFTGGLCFSSTAHVLLHYIIIIITIIIIIIDISVVV